MLKQISLFKNFYYETQLLCLPIVIKQQFSTNLPAENDNEKKTSSNRWTKPLVDMEGEWNTKFRLFEFSQGINLRLIQFGSRAKDISPLKLKTWWAGYKQRAEIADQIFSKQRHHLLGNDLAAANFVVFRGGSVRFEGQEKWFKMNKRNKCDDLPKVNTPGFYVSEIDCSNMNIYYEGLENMVRLKKLTWLSFKNCKTIDDFCLDRISGEYGETLKYLDISGCSITERGLNAFYRLSNLETLVVSNITRSTAFELTCAMLEELFPKLVIESVD